MQQRICGMSAICDSTSAVVVGCVLAIPCHSCYVSDGQRVLALYRRLLTAADEVYVRGKGLGANLTDMREWLYIRGNAAHSIFKGYAWSLDVEVEYAWKELGTLSNIMVVLLVLEVSAVNRQQARAKARNHNHVSICAAISY
jgi:hypothetical protein